MLTQIERLRTRSNDGEPRGMRFIDVEGLAKALRDSLDGEVRFDDGTRGNYWSDDRPFDLDGDGHSDAPYSPVTAFAFLSKQYPDLSVLAHSPAVAALGVAERVLPALRPSEAVDRFPRTSPVRVEGSGTHQGAQRWRLGTGEEKARKNGPRCSPES